MSINPATEAGFTLLELMSVVAIAGILAAFAIPAYRDMTLNNCMTTRANSLVSSFQLARSEAVKRQATVTITATNAAAASNKWGGGWTVWRDADSDNTLDAGEEIRVVQGLSCVTTTIDNATTTYAYDNRGFITLAAAQNFDICDSRTGETGRQISISTTGRPGIDSTYTCP